MADHRNGKGFTAAQKAVSGVRNCLSQLKVGNRDAARFNGPVEIIPLVLRQRETL